MEPPPPLPPSDAAAFLKLLESLPKKKISETAKFVKRVEDIPEISLPPEGPIKVALSLAERALVGQFTGLWPSPKTTESWVARNWASLIKERVTPYFLGKGFFLFEFSDKDDKDLIFRNGPYFMGPHGLYLNKWTPDFDPAVDVPTAVPVWVRLPNLPVHCWNGESLNHIGNTLGKYVDGASNKDQFDCARICVEVDLEIGLPEAIKIRVGSWIHLQKLDYEQLLFKCRKCHVYGHFARSCPKNCEAEKGKEEGWTQGKRSKNAHRAPRTGNTNGNGSQGAPRNQTPILEEQGNKFVQLSSVTEGSQEPEKQKDADRPLIPLHDWQIRLNASDFMSFCSKKAHSTLSFDGASKGNPGRSGAGGVVKKADGGIVLRYAWGVGYNTSIQAEALALLQGLKQLKSLGIQVASVFGDSQTIIKTMVDNASPSDLRLSRLIRRIRTLSNSFQCLNFYHIKRDNNKDADAEANKAVTLPLGVIVRDGVESRDPIP